MLSRIVGFAEMAFLFLYAVKANGEDLVLAERGQSEYRIVAPDPLAAQ